MIRFFNDPVPKLNEIYNSGEQKCFPLLKPGEFQDVILTKNSRREYISNLPKRFDYSMSFCWGYFGTGPIDLSLSALLHFTNEDLAFTQLHALDFTSEVISMLPMTDTVLKAEVILDWIEKAKTRKDVEGFSGNYKPIPCLLGYIFHEGKDFNLPTDPNRETTNLKTLLQGRF